jgi:hypothetical protein
MSQKTRQLALHAKNQNFDGLGWKLVILYFHRSNRARLRNLSALAEHA